MYKSVEARKPSIMRFLGLRKSLIVRNKCDKRARVILSPTPIGHLKKMSVTGDKVSLNIDMERDAMNRSSEEVIAPGNVRKLYSHTSQSYITILIEIDGEWKQLRKDKLINNWRHSYIILQRNLIECIDIEKCKSEE